MDITKITAIFDEAAVKYDEQRRYFIPCFDDYYETSISLLATCRNDFASVLDLGAGTGLLTKYLIQQFPAASFFLVDVSEQMLELAKSRFKDRPNIEYLVADYSKTLPGKNFDLIASALSVHHLDNDTKLKLYTRIYDHLEPGGYLVNLDQFKAGSDFIEKKYREWWNRSIKNSPIGEEGISAWLKRSELDKENTVNDTKSMLGKIGFTHVECIYSFMKFSVIVAVK
jgi:tRNA (cmo5U34)-methyltransferase